MLKKLRNNKKKGFTLVELIVVLVILAILAALLIPALTGYINKAKQKQIVAETRQLVMASQTLVDEQYAKLNKGVALKESVNITAKSTGQTTSTTSIGTDGTVTLDPADIEELAEIAVTSADYEVKVDTNGKIKTAKYTKGTQSCTYSSATKDYTVTP